MHPFFEDYLERLAALHQGCLSAIQGLSAEALDWTPIKNPMVELNSINVLVTHLVGAERYWIGDVALGDASGRVRNEEFIVSGYNAKVLAEKISTATSFAHSALDKLAIDDLPKERLSPRQDQNFTVSWALMHTLEHTAIHLGHIQLTRQLWIERQG